MKVLMSSLILSAAALGTTASAASYVLENHPDGANTPNYDYGLRIDDIGMHFTFINGGVGLEWDGGSIATISGTMNVSTGATVDDSDIGDAWSVNYQMTGVTSDGAGGFTATDGIGSITDGLFYYFFRGKLDPDGFATVFSLDGHRLDGDDSTPVLNGWIRDTRYATNLCAAATDDGKNGICLNDMVNNGQFNDFLATGRPGSTEVPLPAAGWLMIAGLGGLAATRRRRAMK